MAAKKRSTANLARKAKTESTAAKTLDFARGESHSATIRELLAYRVHVVANTISRSAAARYRREFDVTLGEWRTIALLAGYAPLGLNQLARQASVDRGQISRIVAGLTTRGLVSGSHEIKGKPVSLALTAKGKKLFEGLFSAAIDRDEVFLGALNAQERASFDRMLNKILAVARQVEKVEREKSASAED
ncbi:MarR family winged helix-turn-helix transcriptional regulator [Microbacteriaceae bacterium K1510]|nr:MarR family winged helix-turn-helix transcriptional regulator [Microbacteriaceae bacterium K1510]